MQLKQALRITAFTTSIMLMLGPVPIRTQTTTYVNSAREFRGPQIYKSVKSGILFYVESDGRHVSALSPVGEILWCRDPFAEAGLKPYRVGKPLIVKIGPPLDWMVKSMEHEGKRGELIHITFTSSQFGVLDSGSGSFTFLGQD